VDELAGRERTAVALRARPDPRLAREDRTHLEVRHASLDKRVDEDVADVLPRLADDLAVDLDRGRECPRVDRGLDLAVARERAVTALLRDREREAALRAAVLLAD